MKAVEHVHWGEHEVSIVKKTIIGQKQDWVLIFGEITLFEMVVSNDL